MPLISTAPAPTPGVAVSSDVSLGSSGQRDGFFCNVSSRLKADTPAIDAAREKVEEGLPKETRDQLEKDKSSYRAQYRQWSLGTGFGASPPERSQLMLEVEKAAGDLKTRAEQKATRDIEDSLSPDARKRLKADQDSHEEMLKNF